MAWTPGKLDFAPPRGSTWIETIRYRNSDRTPVVFDVDVVAEMQIRTLATRDNLDPTGLIYTLSSDPGATRDYPITLDAASGLISWSIDEAGTIAMNPDNVLTKRYAYSLRLSGAQFGGTRPLIKGTIEIPTEVVHG